MQEKPSQCDIEVFRQELDAYLGQLSRTHALEPLREGHRLFEIAQVVFRDLTAHQQKSWLELVEISRKFPNCTTDEGRHNRRKRAVDIIAELKAAATQTPATNEGGEPYPTPQTYGRDKWIYENIHKCSYATLSRKLRDKAKVEKWGIISSRNGFKKAADRYAEYHSFEKRRFPTE